MKVARRAGEDADIEAKINLYAQQLMTWPERLALACIDEHPRRSIYWPAWKELEDLREEFEASERERRHRLPNPDGSESFTDRVTRLRLHERLGAIGAHRWKAIMGRHRHLADAELFTAVERLEAGKLAFADMEDAA